MSNPQDPQRPTGTLPTSQPEGTPPPLRLDPERDTLLAAFAYLIGGWKAVLGRHPGKLREEPDYADDEKVARRLLDRFKDDVTSPLLRAIEKLKIAVHDAGMRPTPIPDLEAYSIPTHEEAEEEFYAGGNDPVALMVFHHEPGDNDDTKDNEAKFREDLRALIDHVWTQGFVAGKRQEKPADAA